MNVKNTLKVAFLSTYPPRQCGIATFTQDLLRALKKKECLSVTVIAIDDDTYAYDANVWFSFAQQDRPGYIDVAKKLNNSDIDVLVIEHEYGIYGGECGEYLLGLIGALDIPVVTTLHTVLPSPSEIQKQILKALCKKSIRVVTMAFNSEKFLQDIYDVPAEKIDHIHHGVPHLEMPARDLLKKQLHLEGRTIISTFGLIGPGKGLEYAIMAIEDVVKKHDDVLYFILGKTHSVIKKEHGESYRQSLEKMVQERHLQQNIRFVNKYLSKEEIIRYLKLSDIYMTPYLGKEQAVSGTLAYAVAYGKVIVSTPYYYAEEMLADGRGLLAAFRDVRSLADCLHYLIEHPQEKGKMEEKTLLYGKALFWDTVADTYIKTFSGAQQAFIKAK